ncbi:MAG: VOC family protein [Candidatus Cloacimonadota bacterium]|nr:VOC family protein [Candidatus Cloacimonadota bacterium]
MNGIIFFKTKKLHELKKFYLEEIGCEIWLEQADCSIFKFGNMLFGFCNREVIDKCGMITFFYETKEKVDVMYSKFSSIAEDKPKLNPKYKIYHFFAIDPEGRIIEFQWFEKKMII